MSTNPDEPTDPGDGTDQTPTQTQVLRVYYPEDEVEVRGVLSVDIHDAANSLGGYPELEVTTQDGGGLFNLNKISGFMVRPEDVDEDEDEDKDEDEGREDEREGPPSWAGGRK